MTDQIRYAALPIKRLTLKHLVASTRNNYPEIIDRANSQCHVIRKDYGVGSRDGFKRLYSQNRTFYNELRLYSTCTDGKRVSYVRFYGAPNSDTPVWVWCSCPYFLFHNEVVLTRFNSSSIRSSNGQIPIHTNPRMIPHLCKHLVNAARVGLTAKDDLAARKMEEMTAGKEKTAHKLARFMEQKSKDMKIPPNRFTRPPSDMTRIL